MRKRVFSAQRNQLPKTVVLARSSFVFFPADTLCLNMFSCQLFPDASFGGDTKSFTSCDFTHVKNIFGHGFFQLRLSLFFLCQADLFTPIRNCSVNTELIYRMNNLE